MDGINLGGQFIYRMQNTAFRPTLPYGHIQSRQKSMRENKENIRFGASKTVVFRNKQNSGGSSCSRVRLCNPLELVGMA